MALVVSTLQQVFSSFPHTSKYIVAYSGGLDSTVLLHIMHELQLSMHAVHVNHHLQHESDSWQQHCKNICESWEIPLSIEHVQSDKLSKNNIEERARNARYELLFEYLEEQHSLVTAHHKNDLAETLLLQLLRGAGPAGLAAMSSLRNAKMGKHLRPLLEFTRDELLDYANSQDLNWVEDASNDSLDFDRNYLRSRIMPSLLQRWPSALQTLARATELQADAMECLVVLADLDAETAKTEYSHILNVRALQQLSPVRVKNVLRAWIQAHAMRVPSRKLLSHICTDIVFKDEIETSPVQTWSEGEIRRYRDQLYLMAPISVHDAKQEFQWMINQPLHIKSLGRKLQLSDLDRYGIKLPHGVQQLKVCFRSGGESLKPFGSNHHRSLKNLFQEANVPPWERERIPLLYYKDQLVSVLGYWNAADFCETSQTV